MLLISSCAGVGQEPSIVMMSMNTIVFPLKGSVIASVRRMILY